MKADERNPLFKGMPQAVRRVLALAKKSGAQGAAVKITGSRFVEASFRDGNLEKAGSSTRRGLRLTLFVDGRYGVHFTSDLRPEALESFISNAAAMTRSLEPDPDRGLPDPKRQAGPGQPDLEIYCQELAESAPDFWVGLGRDMEQQARREGSGAGEAMVSSQGGAYCETAASLLADSQGFWGQQVETGAYAGCYVVLMDPGQKGKRRSGGWWEGSRFMSRFKRGGAPRAIALEAAARARRQIGAKPGPSGLYEVAVENQAARALVSRLLQALDGRALHQKRSYLLGKQGEVIASPLLQMEDQPLLKKGFGSRWFDEEGVASRPLVMIDKGVLRNYYLDTYYARSLKMKPTTGESSNIVLPATHKMGFDGLVKAMGRGLAVTGFLGGNFNTTTGDFSMGVQGMWIEKGEVLHAVEGMNMAGNYAGLLASLAAVGNDPYPFSSIRSPSLYFAEVQLSGV